MLREEFLKPMNLSVNKLALGLRVPVSRMNDIVHERRSVTADTAIRLALYFDMSAEFWIDLQSDHDLSKIRMNKQKFAGLKREVLPTTAA